MNVTVDLACAQARGGHQVIVLSAGGDYEALLEASGVRHHRCDQRRDPRTLARTLLAYGNIIRRFDPDIVHASMTTGLLIAYALRLGQRYRLIASIHTHVVRRERLMGLADAVIAVSEQVSTTMIASGIAARKISIVQNGTIGSPRVNSGASEPLALDRPSITTVAGMYQRKGISELLVAFDAVATAYPAANLYVVGDGPDRAHFESAARALASRVRIHFVGFCADPTIYLRSTDIFVLPSREEPSGLVLVEAREAGCAIVASDVGGIPEVLDGGSAGVLTPPNDARSLARVIAELLGDPERRAMLGRAAKVNLERLTVRRMSDETLDVYRRALA